VFQRENGMSYIFVWIFLLNCLIAQKMAFSRGV
jgi:hypothetical protein